MSKVAPAERVFSKLSGKPIVWTDENGVVHQCEGAEVFPKVRLIWTMCEIDVPADTAKHPYLGETVNCAACLNLTNEVPEPIATEVSLETLLKRL
jgi:hypothetical protein